MFEKNKNKIIIYAAVAILIYVIITLTLDYKLLQESVSKINFWLIPSVLILSLLNYLSRFIKWHYYLKCLCINLDWRISLKIFFSGLSMSATPGKMGEILKSYFIKELNGEPVSKTSAIILAERLTDMLSLFILALIGLLLYGYSAAWVYIVFGLFIVFMYSISNKVIIAFILNHASKVRLIGKYIQKFEAFFNSTVILLKFRTTVLMTLFTTISWWLECFGFYFIIRSFSQEIAIGWATFTYSIATIAGSISMLPGGLGVTEGSLVSMLIKQNLSFESAVISTFLIRLFTLWFAVLIGSIVLFTMKKTINSVAAKTDGD